MGIIQTIAAGYLKKRVKQIVAFAANPIQTQQEVLQNLISSAVKTKWGEQFHFSEIKNYESFRKNNSLCDYDTIYPWIQKVMEGESNILWPGKAKWFSKSSGTTNNRSKFIPLTSENLEECHFKGGKDMLALYFHNRPKSNAFSGKALTLGGSVENNPFDPKTKIGDLSAILLENLPGFYSFFSAPDKKIALIPDWETKLSAIAEAVFKENISVIVGVPSWTHLLLKRVMELAGKKNIFEVWPGLEVYFHGGVAFDPYRSRFNEITGENSLYNFETYNASEGFFGLADVEGANDMLLMLDYGIFYEFIPLKNSNDENPEAVPLEGTQAGEKYEIVISTNSGLWRYRPGDVIEMTSVSPYRIKVSGRTKSFINAFGEELMVSNTDAALSKTCAETGSLMEEYSVAPIFNEDGSGAHQWVIEFHQAPADKNIFVEALDKNLRALNSDYDAKRSGNLLLKTPVVEFVPKGTFYKWLSSKGKLGGQNKVPRLSPSREVMEEILGLMKQ